MTYKIFFQHFLRNPTNVGALAPLSQSVAAQLTKHLNMRSKNTSWRILEVGAGTGSITKSIIGNMSKHDHLDIVEIDMECCNLLKAQFSKDSRVSTHCLSILDWHPKDHYDFIVSTLPLNSFSPEFVADIFAHYQKLGNEEALCTYVEYIGLEKLQFAFAKPKARAMIRKRRLFINIFLKNHLLEKNKIFKNFLPCHVYHLKLHPSLAIR